MVGPPPNPEPPDDLGALYSSADDDLAPPEGDSSDAAHGDGGDTSGGGGGDILTGLSQRQSLAIIALLSESSLERAAVKAGASERTLRRWLDQPAFQCAYRTARRQSFNQAIGLVVKYATLAVSTLVQTMADANAPHHAKVSAATAVLKFGRDGIELDDLAGRLEAIEASLNLAAPRSRLNGAASHGWRN